MKVVHAIFYQDDNKYGILSGIQCSCMSFMSVSCTLFKSVSTWDSFGLNCILQKQKGIYYLNFSLWFLIISNSHNYRYSEMQNLPLEPCIENLTVNAEFRNNVTAEITDGA